MGTLERCSGRVKVVFDCEREVSTDLFQFLEGGGVAGVGVGLYCCY